MGVRTSLHRTFKLGQEGPNISILNGACRLSLTYVKLTLGRRRRFETIEIQKRAGLADGCADGSGKKQIQSVIDTNSSQHLAVGTNQLCKLFHLAVGGRSSQGSKQMTDKESAPPRYMVREGCKGWMVYDRQRKGPAMVGTNPVVNLTRERANHIAHWLTAESQDKSNHPSRPQ